MADYACTHRARLQRDPEFAIFETLLPQRLSSPANRQHLGMSRRVFELTRRIMSCRNDSPIAHYYGPNRHFALRGSLARGIKRGGHKWGKRPSGHGFSASRPLVWAQARAIPGAVRLDLCRMSR